MSSRSCVIAIACVSLLSGLAIADDDPAKEDLASLQGEWQCMLVESDGQRLSGTECKAIKLTVKGNKARTLHGAKISKEATVKLTPSENPRAMDMSAIEGKLLGIYSIEKDILRICIGAPGEKRPTEFKGREKTALFLFKRTGRQSSDSVGQRSRRTNG
jgi:uncharacterized protein (TIGR03067 family)